MMIITHDAAGVNSDLIGGNMDPRVAKLERIGIEDAEVLVEAGFDRPSKIRKAKNADLEKVISKAKTTALRKKLPARSRRGHYAG